MTVLRQHYELPTTSYPVGSGEPGVPGFVTSKESLGVPLGLAANDALTTIATAIQLRQLQRDEYLAREIEIMTLSCRGASVRAQAVIDKLTHGGRL